ncbi:HNH endonuclease signature motif containing protein [Myceligenerans xiligouense]|uniref:HNH nuclease domain-containing protein n=1 Tax=Myceligenerans xiligouense TaxID=253184 RepID=A0A3N4YGM7_9MICO|nr:HNH endonuclease signature motif containing protein [Myceligenerans xiligouense]RPF20279.1 hypothetical protein EDD34_0862 [Myceligenerans xiligouense]
MRGSVFDDGAGHVPDVGAPFRGSEGEAFDGGAFDAAEFDANGFDADGFDGLEDVEVVDQFGLPVRPPDHTERELAAILATDPLNDPESASAAAEFMSRGPDGQPGVVVDRARLLLESLGSSGPGVALAGTLTDLTGLEPSFDAPSTGADRCAHDTPGPSASDHGTTGGCATGESALQALTDGELRSVVAGWERIVSWARAAQARVAAELMARTDGPLGRDSAAGEIADELHVTTSEGWLIAARGEGVGQYPDLADALCTGRIDAKKADTFLRAGADLTVSERGDAITDLLPAAPGRTWRWISEQMNARAAVLHGRKARRREVMDRCNVWAEQAGPGMGRIIADLPVTDAARTFNTVQAAAKALKDVPGETRPLGALRAAALAALVTDSLVLPCPDPHDSAAAAGDEAVVEPPRPVEPVLDTDLIPIPADPHGIVLTGPAPAGPGTGSTSTTSSATSAGSDAAAGTRVRVVDVSAIVNVTVPAGMLLDPEDMTPGVLEGIGPIPADHAARIAGDATWRRLVTDPVSGILTDYSTRAYAPGATLRAAVATRDRSCRFPGCDRPALTGTRTALDLDHIQAFDHDHHYRPGEPGQTRATNLHPLCRKHHNLKTHANWQVTRDPDTGLTRWTAPTGTTTDVEPAITDPTIRYALAHGMTLAEPPAPAGGAPGDDETGRERERHPDAPPF